jgi:hypothetical protein
VTWWAESLYDAPDSHQSCCSATLSVLADGRPLVLVRRFVLAVAGTAVLAAIVALVLRLPGVSSTT